MHDRLKPLVSLPFIVCLVLLMVNDFYLKATFHNVFTGKLSDLCGLFIFPIFWSALFPQYKLRVFILSAFLFIYWKSEYASPFIGLFSNYIFTIRRIIDPTDLIALPVLALAWLSLKYHPTSKSINTLPRQLSSYIVAAAALFSFCATSKPRYVQSFDQPQYVLFKSDTLPDSNTYSGEYEFYKFDSLLVVKVNEMYMSREAAKNDDYNKNKVVAELDRDVIDIVPGIKSLMPPLMVTSLTIKTPHGDDSVRFNGSRLDGKFVRKKAGKVIIEGIYKLGIEDSIWTFKDTINSTLTKVTFVNGERTKIQQFNGDKLVSSNSINTRANTIRNKYIQIVFLVMCTISCVILIIRNYRKAHHEKLQTELGWKLLLCFTLPVAVWLLQFGIIEILGDYKQDFFLMIATVLFVYIITCPMFFIILFWIKLSKLIDVFWYTLFLALAFSLWLQYGVLVELSV